MTPTTANFHDRSLFTRAVNELLQRGDCKVIGIDIETQGRWPVRQIIYSVSYFAVEQGSK